MFRSCIAPLHPLLDNGHWNEFERAAEKLLEEGGGDLTRRIIISLETSVVLSIKKELERSEEMINSVASEISQTSGSDRLLLEVILYGWSLPPKENARKCRKVLEDR